MAIWLYFVVIWYIFPRFGILDQEKSGNPDPTSASLLLNHDLNHECTSFIGKRNKMLYVIMNICFDC
jgi:hypothetical protein